MSSLIQGPKSKSRSSEEHQDLVCASGGNQKICIPKDYQKYDLPTTKGLGIRVTQLFKQRLKPSEFQDLHLLQLELTSRIFRKYQTRILASHWMHILMWSGEIPGFWWAGIPRLSEVKNIFPVLNKHFHSRTLLSHCLGMTGPTWHQ